MEQLLRKCMDFALENGASQVRITYNESLMDLVGMLDGEVDKVTHSLDRSLTLALFADGRYGTFSTNRLDSEESLRRFILDALDMTRMLVEDPCRKLPPPERKVQDATQGDEAGLFDPAYQAMTEQDRLDLAHRSSLWAWKASLEKGFTLLSEEGEYSDSIYRTLILDSEGLYCQHRETSFEIGYEVTVADAEGNRFSGYWWDASPRLDDIRSSVLTCSEKAVQRAAAQIGPVRIPGGKMNLVIQSECASKLLTPLVTALGGYAIQQQNSFLLDSLGKQVFSGKFTVRDLPRSRGEMGAKWFDSEGVAALDAPVIENGIIRRYFINTYIAAKTGLVPTVEDRTRLVVQPTGEGFGEADLLSQMGEGILVTGFNGGNNNTATGDFSYGIEGFAFAGGEITHPVREMLMTGNFLTLWQHLEAVADDARPCMSQRIPTLAFREVDVR